MLNIVLFGPPGSGKGTQSLNIIKKYESLKDDLDHVTKNLEDNERILNDMLEVYATVSERLEKHVEYCDQVGIINKKIETYL